MPIAIVRISDRANKIINIVKARHGLKDKSEAINKMAELYEEECEPALRPEFVRKMNRIAKQKPIFIGTSDDFRKRYGRSPDNAGIRSLKRIRHRHPVSHGAVVGKCAEIT